MDKIENIDDIRSLIALGIEECTTLEYKSGIDTSNNHWKSEMAKDVSAMANANGGIITYAYSWDYTTDTATKVCAKNVEIGSLPTVNRDGCTFLGWYDNPEFNGNPIESIEIKETGYIKLYAKWEEENPITE